MSEHPTSAPSRAPEPDDGGPAFPVASYDPQILSPVTVADAERLLSGMSLRAYFMAHAPAEPQPWFYPVMPTPKEPRKAMTDSVRNLARAAWDREAEKRRYLQWPAAWADEQLAILRGRP